MVQGVSLNHTPVTHQNGLSMYWHNFNPESGDYSEEYQAIYHESLIRQLFSRKYIWATHVWNMFDFGADARAEGGENGQNHKGLITIDRKYKKDSFYAYKAWLNPEPMIHLCGKRYIDRVEDVTRVTVCSNQPEMNSGVMNMIGVLRYCALPVCWDAQCDLYEGGTAENERTAQQNPQTQSVRRPIYDPFYE